MHAGQVALGLGWLVVAAGCGGAPPSQAAGPKAGGEAETVRIAAPEGLVLDAKGNLYVSEFEGNRVDRIAPDGTLEVVIGAGELDAPTGLAVTAEGRLLVADHHNDRIQALDSEGELSTVPGSVAAGLDDPIGIALADADALYVADERNARVLRIERSGESTVVVDALRHPAYVVLDEGGDVLFTDFLDNRIRRVDGNGVITTVAGTGSPGFAGDGGPATEASLSFPTGLALDADGSLYVSDANNNRVRHIDRQGVITTVAGTGVAGFGGDGGHATAAMLDAPAGLAFDAVGNLYVADQGNDRVRRIDLDGVITIVAGRG